jgi:hypothetical protein
VQSWPGAELVSARSIERTLARQRSALALLTAAALAGVVVLPRHSGLPLAYVAAVGAIGVLTLWVVQLHEHDRGDRSADALIEVGFRADRRVDEVSRAVADRVRRLESDRRRRRLAEALRVHLELDRTPRSPGALRCGVSVRRGFADHRGMVDDIATAFEQRACDPRAIIQVERLLTMPPPPVLGETERVELGRRLQGIIQLIEAGP